MNNMANTTKMYTNEMVGEEQPSKLLTFITILNEELDSYRNNLERLEHNISKFNAFYEPEPIASSKSIENEQEVLAVELEKIIDYIRRNNNRLSIYKDNIKTII